MRGRLLRVRHSVSAFAAAAVLAGGLPVQVTLVLSAADQGTVWCPPAFSSTTAELITDTAAALRVAGALCGGPAPVYLHQTLQQISHRNSALSQRASAHHPHCYPLRI